MIEGGINRLAQTSRARNMADQDRLAQLEAERDRLLSMITYHNGSFYRRSPVPAWFVVVSIAMICAIGISIVAGILTGQIPASLVLFLIVGLPLLAYILTRKITVFGTTLLMGEILSLFLGVVTPVGRPVGETEARQRLADCEAQIAKLKGARS
jgi:hypothetical protein